jgi:hypothetical protein
MPDWKGIEDLRRYGGGMRRRLSINMMSLEKLWTARINGPPTMAIFPIAYGIICRSFPMPHPVHGGNLTMGYGKSGHVGGLLRIRLRYVRLPWNAQLA